MATRELTIINALGLHARASAKVVTLTQRFSSSITLSLDGSTVDASSIMGLLMLAGARGRTLTATATGDDAEAALDALEALFNDRFGENE